jgi:4-nitrophenyl phosphatase
MPKLIQELDNIKLAIFDLDGVIYRGNSLIKGVKQVVKDLKDLSIKVVYNSNNSTATRRNYVDRLEGFDIECSIEDFYTSASIASVELTKLKSNSKIYIIGETGLQKELEARGHEIITEESRYLEVDFVVVGLDRNFTYQKLAVAQRCLLQGKAKFYATNADATLPASTGLLPGAGVMVNAVQTCTNINPEKVFGKPNPEGIETILREQNVAKEQAVIFGDRLDTDIVAGNRANIFTVMILTGVTTEEMVINLKGDSKANSNLIPGLILNSLKEIFI